MNKKYLGNGALFISAILSLIISFDQAGWKINLDRLGFEAWIILPYPVCWLLCIPLYKVLASKYSTIAVVFSILISLFTLFGYVGFYIGHQSSTGSLAFIFVPLYLLIASVCVLGITNAIQFFRNRVNVAA